jgi:uncharacterized Zn-binding protein involved in type VI secretion
MGICAGHQMIGPTGSPVPSPPLPFAAPLTMGLVANVLLAGKPAAVVGSSGVATPPHVGLHASDPFMVPTQQKGTVTTGSATVLIGGQPAATMNSVCTMCMAPAQSVVATAATVLIG